jgi:hypothetical protein
MHNWQLQTIIFQYTIEFDRIIFQFKSKLKNSVIIILEVS